MTITEVIDDIRRRQSLSDAQIGERLGYTNTAVYYVRTGKRRPGTGFLRALAKEFPQYTGDVMNYTLRGEEKEVAVREEVPEGGSAMASLPPEGTTTERKSK